MRVKSEFRFILFYFMALILTIIPLPAWLSACRPPWVLFLLLYTRFFLSVDLSLIHVFFLGICLDVLLSTLLGEHAFALTLTLWLASTRDRIFAILPLLRQVLEVSFLCFFYEFIFYLIDVRQGFNARLYMVLGSTFLSFIVWPWVSMLMARFFRGRSRSTLPAYFNSKGASNDI